MVVSLRSLFRLPLLFLVVGGVVLGGCDSGGLAPDLNLKNGVALSGSENTEVAAVATHREGEWLVAFSRADSTSVREVVYRAGDGNRTTIKLDPEGRPSLAVSGPHVLTFGNYNGNRADVGLIDTESGTVRTSDQVALGIDVSTLELPGTDSTDISPAQAMEKAGYGATVFSCSMAALSAPDSSSAGTSCQTSTLLQVATSATEQGDWEDSAKLLGFGIDSGVCANHGASCLTAIAEESDAVLEEGQALIDENQQSLAEVSGVVRFGGTWAYRDISQRWFIVKQDFVYDVIFNDDIFFGECYDINRLKPLDTDGNVFRYEEQESGNITRLSFERTSTDVLTATRLSDGTQIKWDRAPSQNLQNFLDNSCDS